MRMNRTQKNYMIIGLCALVLLMAVGYAAFSSQLKISGTSNVTSNWDVRITNIQSKDIVGGAGNKVEPSYDVTTATFSASLQSPGDSISYDVTVSNNGSIDAKLDEITMTDSSNSAIIFETSGLKEGDLLAQGENAILTVKVSYNSAISGQPENLNATLKVTLDYSQAEAGYVPPTASQTIYAWNTNEITVGTSRVEDLESTKTAVPYYESAEEVMSASGYTFFNKYTVVDDVITEGYTCQTFGVLSTPVCVQGVDPAYYNYQNSPGNWSVLNTLNSNETFTSAGGSCTFDSSDSSCRVGAFDLYADSYGYVYAYVSSASARCDVIDDGYAYCNG